MDGFAQHRQLTTRPCKGPPHARASPAPACCCSSCLCSPGGAKLLNPLYVAQQRLQEASNLLQQGTQPEELTAALQLVRSSSLNCYIFEALPDDTIETRASLLTQKYELSVSDRGSGGGGGNTSVGAGCNSCPVSCQAIAAASGQTSAATCGVVMLAQLLGEAALLGVCCRSAWRLCDSRGRVARRGHVPWLLRGCRTHARGALC